MTRREADEIARDASQILLTLAPADHSIQHRIEGARLLVTQALSLAARMTDPDALATLAEAAEIAGEILHRTAPQITHIEAGDKVTTASASLISLAHRHAIDNALEERGR